MKGIFRILGASVVGLAAGCAPALSNANKDLGKYTDSTIITEREARVLIEAKFDRKPKDGVISDEEALEALDWCATIPNNSPSSANHTNYQDTRRVIEDQVSLMRAEGKERAKAKAE